MGEVAGYPLGLLVALAIAWGFMEWRDWRDRRRTVERFDRFYAQLKRDPSTRWEDVP